MIHSKAIVWHPEETPINNSDKDETGQESRKVCTLSLGGYSLAMLLNKNLQVSLVKNAESLHIPTQRKPSDRRGPLLWTLCFRVGVLQACSRVQQQRQHPGTLGPQPRPTES